MKFAMSIIAAASVLFLTPQIVAAADGKEVYDKACAGCHEKGIAGAAKISDKAKWAPILKQGSDALTATVIKGKGVMPPKGGNASLSDADIKAAVDYIAQQAK
jgi:cytochrome c5